MTNEPTPSPKFAAFGPRLAWFLAVGYAACGLAAMWLLAPRVPYADPWRYYARFLGTPFPGNAVAADNGHVEALPNLVRIAELHGCAADQSLQVGLGMVLAVLAAVALWRCAKATPPAARAAAALVVTVGLFWLGNARKLAHGNESVPLFLVILCVLFGLRQLSAATPPTRRAVALATASGCLATFCFGSGFASFFTFAVVLACQRPPARHFLPLAIGTAACFGVLLGHGKGVPLFDLGLLEGIDLLLRWIGAPFVWVFSPLLDPEHAARLPWAPLRALTQPIADAVHARCGPHLAAHWPAAAFGILGLLWTCAATFRLQRSQGTGLARIGIGLAWFAIGVGGLVVAMRLTYFRQWPEQITTQRYLPWSMLLWTGLLLARIAAAPRARSALWPAFVFAALFAPSQVWTGRYAHKQLVTAETTALGAAVGVLPRDFDLVETREADLLAALPKLRTHRVAMFAWPEVQALDEPNGGLLHQVPIEHVELAPVTNRLPGPGSRIAFAAPVGTPARLLVLDAQRRPCGIAVRLPLVSLWQGFVRGTHAAADLRAARLP